MATLESHTDYVFTPLSLEERLQQTTGQSLPSWTIGPATSTPEEVESGRGGWSLKKATRLYAGCINHGA
uniref:Uncharacterized protein n=1 Tax=Hyaloperonospora arabidopsidis (strain Emoy2) TaxID=559515 RepID=M4C4W3_HYAAE